MRRRRYIFVSRGLVPRSGFYPRSRRHHHLLPGGHLCIHQRYARSAQRSPPGNENHIRTHPRENDQQRSCCAYPSTPHWRSLCGDKALYINHVPRSGSNYRASTGGRFGTAPRYGIERASGPHKGTTLRPLRLPCASCHCGAGGIRNRSAVHVISIFVGATAAYRLLWIFANGATCGKLLTHFLLHI